MTVEMKNTSAALVELVTGDGSMSERTDIESRLLEMGFRLPQAIEPRAEYVAAKRVGDLVYVSGQGPITAQGTAYVGQVGGSVTPGEAYTAAQICALNGLAAVKSLVGSLEMVEEIVQVRGFVNSAAGFHDQPRVVDGASELLVKVFGSKGQHARAALGTSSLPSNIPVEIEMLVRIKPGVGA